MSLRRKPTLRCERCSMRTVLCLCNASPNLKLRTRVTVLMHWRETKTTTNTARLACVALTESEIRLRGDREHPLNADGLVREGVQSLFLYPSDDATELTPEFVSNLSSPVHLIVPDGSWRQARKVASREPALHGIRHVKLPKGNPSTYRLRYSPHEENVCTFEAIARALGVLEGPQEGSKVQEKLEQFFEMMVERILWSRGMLPTQKCKTEIPHAAIQAFFEDGCRGSQIKKNISPSV